MTNRWGAALAALGLITLAAWPVPLPFYVSAGELVLLVVMVAAVIIGAKHGQKVLLPQGSWLAEPALPFVLALVAMFAAAGASRNPGMATTSLLTWGTGLIILLGLPMLLQQADPDGNGTGAASTVLAWAVLGGAIVAAYGLWDYYAAMRHLAPGRIYRTPSVMLDPQLVSAYLTLLLPFASALHLKAANRPDRWLWGLAAIIMAAGLTVTYTRAGWLGSLGAAFILGWLTDRRFWLKAAAVVLLLSLIFPGVLRRAASSSEVDADTSITGRFALWKAAALMFEQHPVLGVGLGNYTLELSRLEQQGILQAPPDARYPHNSLLYALSETGLLGFIPVLWLAALLLLRIAKALPSNAFSIRREPGPPPDFILAGALASLLAFGFHANFQSLLYTPAAAIPFWLVIGAVQPFTRKRQLAAARLDSAA